MSFKPIEKDKRIDKVIEILRIGGRSEEKFIKHKCWLLLGYCSGLRAEDNSYLCSYGKGF